MEFNYGGVIKQCMCTNTHLQIGSVYYDTLVLGIELNETLSGKKFSWLVIDGEFGGL